jgi:hypothetical protein
MRLASSAAGLLVALVALAATSCSSYSDYVAEARLDYRAGAYAASDEKLSELVDDEDSDQHFYLLERGVVQLALQDAKRSERMFSRAQDRMDEIGPANALDWMGAMLLDDRSIPNPGADYEQVLVRAMLALANLMGDGRDAKAYANAILRKQLELRDAFGTGGIEGQQNPKLNTKLVGFGSYLQGILAEEEAMKRSEARAFFEEVRQHEPAYAGIAEDLARVTDGQYAAPGHGVVYVLALTGLGPTRVEGEEPISSTAFLIAQIAWQILRDRAVLPNLTAIRIPVLAFERGNPECLEVRAIGAVEGLTQTVTDVEQVAQAEFDAMKDWIIARAIMRRFFKIGITEASKEIANQSGDPWVDIGISVLGMIWTGTEVTDTRSWSFLPARFQTRRLELPEGVHELELRAVRGGNPTGAPQRVRVRVLAGQSTYVLALTPTTAGGPPPLCSRPADEPAPSPNATEISS